MAAVVINNTMGKRKKEQDDNDSSNKKGRVVWTKTLHEKFVAAVKKLGQQDAVPRRIAALMNVDGITTKHVASHLQKYRLGDNKKAINQDHTLPSSTSTLPTQSQTSTQAHMVSSTLILQQPTQSQNIYIHPSYNFPVTQKPLHQSDSEIYSPPGLNVSGVAAPLTLTRLIQSQNINNNSLNIHPPPSTFPLQSQNINNNSFNIHPSYHFPVKQTSTLLLPNNMPLQHSHTTLPNPDIYSPTGFNISGLTPSTLIPRPTQSLNINDSSSIIHPPPSTFPIYHQHTSTFPPLVNQSTTPPVFATTLDFHDTRSRASNCPFVGSSSKSPSIWDYDWYTKYMKREPHLNNSLPESESDKTSQNSQMSSQQTEPFMDGSASSLEYTNIDISDYNLCSENSPIDFSVEETNCNTLDLHDVGTFVGSASSKSTSIWDCDWYTKYLKRESESLQFSHNSFPVMESEKTSQINNSHNVEPFIVGSASCLEEKNNNIWCNDDTPIDFSVEETDPNTLEDIDVSVEETDPNTLKDIRNMVRFIEDEDLINAWKCFQEEDITNVMHQP